jgi:DNA-binding NarL/FixJ family response regulator
VGHWLAEHEEIEHVGAAHTGEEAIELLEAEQPDVVLLDTMGAPGDGALLAKIREVAPQARVVVYSGYLSIVDSDALGGDADAYLAKGDDDGALIAMIRAVAER